MNYFKTIVCLKQFACLIGTPLLIAACGSTAATPDAGAVDAGAEVAAAADVDPDWRPSWKDDAGCNVYEHMDKAANKCVSNNLALQKAEKSCWDYGQVNVQGVGKPCQPGVVECKGLVANCCHVDDRKYGAMCTTYCDKDADCGENTWCATFHICMPATCKAGFTDPTKPKNYNGKGFSCPEGTKGTEGGVGLLCKKGGKECDAKKPSDPTKFDPAKGDYDPDLHCFGEGGANLPDDTTTSFCSHDCSSDEECGPGSVCIYANGAPFFCVPKTCAAQFDNMVFESAEDPDADPGTGPASPVCNKPPNK